MSNILEAFLREDYVKWGDRDYLFEKKNGRYESITFGQFIENVHAYAVALCQKGFHGKNIGIYSPNCTEWMIAEYAVACYVGISVGIPKDWAYERVEYAVKKCEIACLLYNECFADNIERLKKAFPEVTFLSIQKDFATWVSEGKAAADLFTLPAKDDEKPAKIVFTSGTTSLPKAVMLSAKNIFSGYMSLGRRAPLGVEDVCYLFLPLNHTYGSIYNFTYSLVFGYQIYFASSLKEMASEMQEVRPTVFSGVPVVFSRFYEGAKAAHVTLQTLFGGRMKYLFSGGAPLGEEIRNAYQAEGMYMMNAYGLSETSSGFCIDYPEETDLDSAGTLMEEIDAVVLEPDADGYGELAVKGDLVFCGYYGDEAATAKMFSKDGYFLTGDIGTIQNKKVYLKGRKDARLSLPNGETISIPALEAKIKALRENVTAVKIYLRDDILTADLYVKPVELAEDQALWATLMEQLNQSLAVFERIGQYHVYGADQLHVKLVAE